MLMLFFYYYCFLCRFSGADFLARWRGKKIMFVGDSLSLNMWESLACMIHAAVPTAKTTFSKRNSVTFVVSLLSYFTSSSPFISKIKINLNRSILSAHLLITIACLSFSILFLYVIDYSIVLLLRKGLLPNCSSAFFLELYTVLLTIMSTELFFMRGCCLCCPEKTTDLFSLIKAN